MGSMGSLPGMLGGTATNPYSNDAFSHQRIMEQMILAQQHQAVARQSPVNVQVLPAGGDDPILLLLGDE